MSQTLLPASGFDEMNLSPSVHKAIQKTGYEKPTPIQAMTIPHLVQGKDVLGQARTGTGKTAAFALPLLSRIKLDNRRPQVLVLTPTRELAIQVADSFKTYGSAMKGLNVLPVYGGQSYGIQLDQLKRGVHVVVGTPGRLMDHMKRKTLSFTDVFCTVLDEADEMLHMGFIDDVEWIMDKTPGDGQTALFSATMPGPIRRISQKYLSRPEEIILKPDTAEITTIDQQYWMVNGTRKTHALTRFLEAASFDGVIVFTKTKAATTEVSSHLEEKGFKAEALNGDMAQNAREQTVNRLKNGHIDILVATDVAARGLDVNRISHVINFDMPSKTEPYVHRIGRTGRAGRSGEAILFLNRNQRWMLKKLEKATKRTIREIRLPSDAAINKKRVAQFKASIDKTLASGATDLQAFQALIEAHAEESGMPVAAIAAALAKQAHGSTPFMLKAKTQGSSKKNQTPSMAARDKKTGPDRPRSAEGTRQKAHAAIKSARNNTGEPIPFPEKKKIPPPEKGMERYRIEVGRNHGVKARDIVGAISNEAGLESKFIKGIDINREFTFVDLPFGMPKEVFRLLKRTWVKSRQMSISKCA